MIGQRTVRLLDEDRGLGARLGPESFQTARAAAVARTIELEPGRWRASTPIEDDAGDLGLLILGGLMTRDTVLGGRLGSELLGGGDIVRPTDHDGDLAPVPFDVVWTVLQRTTLAILDRRFALTVARWPEITAELMHRAICRSKWLALRLAIGQLGRIDQRVNVLLWHLADRWGHVSPEGVTMPFRLTHEQLAHLVGARRPSVTSALTVLAERGDVTRNARGRFVLHGDPPALLGDARRSAARAPGWG